MTDEYLWPARNVAEYAYCPRLFYLMEVEGVHLPSADTELGHAVHRRVNRPSAKPTDDDEPDPEKPKVIRSLTLSSHALGLTATMDLTEISGNVAVPIEYRKGRPKRKTMAPPPDDPEEADNPPLSQPEAWPIDRVQVGLQAVLLKNAGYEVTQMVIYYAAEKFRLEIPFDDVLENEAIATLEAARLCAQAPRPKPLVNDPRCPRCSLQPICLPDEVNCQSVKDTNEEITPRKIWPPRDDGIHVVTQTNGSKISIKGMTLVIKDKDGTTLKEIPVANIETLSLLGSVQISTQAVHVLADRCIPIAYLSSAGRLVAMIDPLDSVSAEIRKAQVTNFVNPQRCLELSRSLVSAKVTNQRTLLMRNNSSLHKGITTELAKTAEMAAQAGSLDELRGHEGRAGALYFKHFAGMLKSSLADEFDANGRQRRPPPDPVNACLSLAYSMLTHECVAALRLARLEPSIGAYHVSRPGRPAVALDLMEPFRPLIADSVALSLFNRGELCEGHFLRTAAGCSLTDAGRKAFFSAYARRMDMEITHPFFDYRLSYRRMLVLHARMIAAWLLGEVSTLAFLTTR